MLKVIEIFNKLVNKLYDLVEEHIGGIPWQSAAKADLVLVEDSRNN